MLVLDLMYGCYDDWGEEKHTCRASLAITPRAICILKKGNLEEKE
jgi:hypothetical protein